MLPACFPLILLHLRVHILICVDFWFLLNFPDADFPVVLRGSAEHVAMFSRAQCLNAVGVCHQLLLHRVPVRVHHVDLPAGFSCGAAAVTAHPDLTPGHYNAIFNLLLDKLMGFDRGMNVSHLTLDFDHAHDTGAVFELDPDEGFVQVSAVPHTQLSCVCEPGPQLLRLQTHSDH